MTATVTLARTQLREALLDLLVGKAKAIEDALLPIEGDADPGLARAHYADLEAVGELLTAIGWLVTDSTLPYTLDLAVHGWAAAAAMRRLVYRERVAAREHAAVQDEEAAGEAGGRRRDAEDELDRIRAACRRARLAITRPTPRPFDPA